MTVSTDDLLRDSGIDPGYDPSKPDATPTVTVTTAPAGPTTKQLLNDSGIPDDYIPENPKAKSSLGHDIADLAFRGVMGFGKGVKDVIDVPAEFLARNLGGNALTDSLSIPNGQQTKAADDAATATYMKYFGKDPLAYGGELAGKLAGAVAMGAPVRVGTIPYEATRLITSPLNPLRVPPAWVMSTAANAAQGAIGATVTGGNPLLGAAGGATIGPLADKAGRLADNKVVNGLVGATAGALGWKYGTPADALMGVLGGPVLSHYLEPVKWFMRGAARVPGAVGAVTGQAPNPLVP